MSTTQSPFSILRNKTEEPLSGKTFERFAVIPENDRTSYAWARTDTAARGETAKQSAVLGFGYLHAILAMLTLFVHTVTFTEPGAKGRVEAQTGASGIAYSFSWNEEDEDYCQQGGFIHGGIPNYHSAVLGLVQCIAMYLSGERIQSHELVTRWLWLLREMDRRYPRLSREEGWPAAILSDACRESAIRDRILQCCDSLRVAMQYNIATQTRREVMVSDASVLEPHEVALDDAKIRHLKGPHLLDWRHLLELAEATPLLPSPKPVSDEELAALQAEAAKETERDLPDLLAAAIASGILQASLPREEADGAAGRSPEGGIEPRESPAIPAEAFPGSLSKERGGATAKASAGMAAKATMIPSSPIVGTSEGPIGGGVGKETSPLAALLKGKETASPHSGGLVKPLPSSMYGPYVEQVDMIVAQGNTVMCTGPTGTGKTEIFLEQALRNAWGIELIVLHSGKKIPFLQGAYVRSSTGDFRFAAGPLARFARRVMNGERVMLLLDELARAEEKVFAYVMDLLNTFKAQQVLSMQARDSSAGGEMKLIFPSDFGRNPQERYHIVTIDALQERYVLADSQVRIVGIANQGEGYEGHDFSDPAFLRRWYHWIHLTGYDDDVIRSILADRLHIRASAPLIDAMLQVKKQVYAYQAADDMLKMPLCLPLLIIWGEQTLWYVNDASSSLHGALRPAFELAARMSWVNRICPFNADGLDPQVEIKLLGFIRSATLKPTGI